jgi:ABC-type nitrate/sulfonate/bicarbonate transport system permease component
VGSLVQGAGRSMLSNYSLVLVFLAWELTAQLGLIRHAFLPPLSEVVVQSGMMLREDVLLSPIITSLYRAIAGLAISVMIGAPIGLASARFWSIRMINDPLISIGFPLPKIALIPIFTLWFGIYDNSKIALVVFTCIFPIAMAVESAVSNVSTVMQWSARSLGASSVDLMRTVILPASMPGLMSGVRVALPLALLATFTAEMVGGGGGIGAALMYAQRLFDTPTVFVYILIMLVLGLGSDKLFLLVRRRFLRWSDEY